MDPKDRLKAVDKKHDFLIGIDSDGCTFDTMELKHKECFCPNFIEYFQCQAISKYAREAWDFVNLYSRTRGCNRWLAVQRTIKLLDVRKECRRRGAHFPMEPAVDAFIAQYDTYSNATMAAFVDENEGEMKARLRKALAWSEAVNASIARMVHDVPPFPGVRESLEAARDRADMIVVSQTPVEALEREWREHGIDRFVQAVAGQEMGKKSEHIALAAAGRYAPGKVLMIGDAPGDRRAAQANDALFYPIIPGAEETSWARFHEEALERFFAGDFAGDYQRALIDEFLAHLPETPPWEG
jgi:phosphoglycolate phosphatase-like HAD superfamily hydrolase